VDGSHRCNVANSKLGNAMRQRLSIDSLMCFSATLRLYLMFRTSVYQCLSAWKTAYRSRSLFGSTIYAYVYCLNFVGWIDLPFFCLCSVSPLLRRYLELLAAFNATPAAHILCALFPGDSRIQPIPANTQLQQCNLLKPRRYAGEYYLVIPKKTYSSRK
jgi:hypothetical protein